MPLRRALLLITLVTTTALLVAPIAFTFGTRRGNQEYTEEIERLRRDLVAARDQNGIFLAPDNYAKLTSTIENQEKEIVEKVNHIRALQEESEKKQAVFAELKAALDERTTALKDRESQLCDTRASLHKTKQDLQRTELQRDEQSHLVERRADTERRLAGQASQLLTTVSETTADLRGVHDKLDRKRSLEERNEAVTREFRVQFQSNMARLESALGAAFQQQREFCKGMYANLGEAVERRKHESSSLTALLGSLLGSQTEQLRELESHAQSATGGAHAWIGAQLAAVAARREQQGELHTALQRRLTVGAEAALQRLERQDAAFEKAAAEQRSWLSAHSAQMEAALSELATLLQGQNEKRIAEYAERMARLERENQRLLDKQANFTALIESLQSNLASIASATAASSKATQALASGVGDDGSASAAALAAERAQLEAMQREEGAAYADAGQRLSRARSQLGEDHARLDQIQQQAKDEISLQSGEARGELERARSSWGPALAELTDGWEQHCQRQEEALRARSEAVNGELQHSQQRVQGLAGSLHGAVRGADQQLEAQSRAFFATIRDRQGELTDQCGRIEQQAVDIGQMVRQRDNEVEVFVVETLQRDASTGGTPQRRDFSYPRYLAATSPHERILQRFRSAHRRNARSHSSGADDVPPLPPLDAEELLEESSDSVATVPEKTPSPVSAPEPHLPRTGSDQRLVPAPLPRAPSASDLSDTGSDVENRAPEKRFDGEFAVPAARRHHRRGLRAPKVHVTRQSSQESPAQSPRKGVLGSRND